MAKLHEVLAVEGELEGAYKQILAETEKTFSGKPGFFMGSEERYESFLDESAHDFLPPEHQELTTTVPDKLSYMFNYVVRYVDAVLQKDASNQKAVADLVVDGVEIAKAVPATTLLGLESKLKQVRAVLLAMPTLPAGIRWMPDEQLGKNVFRAEKPVEKVRTLKRKKFITVAEATTQHPAQVKEDVEEYNAGRKIKETWSGMVSSARKSEIIGNLDKLARAVKQARQRANCVDVENVKLGKKLVEFIMQ